MKIEKRALSSQKPDVSDGREKSSPDRPVEFPSESTPLAGSRSDKTIARNSRMDTGSRNVPVVESGLRGKTPGINDSVETGIPGINASVETRTPRENIPVGTDASAQSIDALGDIPDLNAGAQNRNAYRLPPGVPSSLPWLMGLLALPLIILAAAAVGLLAYAPTLPLLPLAVGLLLTAVCSLFVGMHWLYGRHGYLLALAAAAERLELPSLDESGKEKAGPAIPRLTGPFPVLADDEAGYLAARMNGVAGTLRWYLEAAESERLRMSSILAYMDSGVALTDRLGRVLLVNPAAERLLGRTSRSLLGRTILEGLLQPDLAAGVENAVAHSQTASIPLYVDTSRRHVLAVVSPLGEPMAGAVLLFQDQEEQKRLESVRRDFVANVSHELRTPLASIRAVAESLQSGALEEPEHAGSFLEMIIQETDRLAHLTDDLLDLARYESGRLDRFPVDLGELIAEVEKQIRVNARHAGLNLDCSIGNLPPVCGDRSALRQVFLNLLDNAVKYTTSGTIGLTAKLDSMNNAFDADRQMPPTAANGCSMIAVEISDTGPGIPAEHLPRIFERFYRVDKGRSRQLGGTGLGLSIVRHVVEAHGGCVRVRSTVNAGSTFTVWLPAPETQQL